MIQYGFLENLTISSFYTEADDPLYEKIRNVEKQPANLWSNYGVGLRWGLIKKNNFNLSILSPGNTIAAMLANQFGEADGSQVSSLMFAALILMVLTLLVNIFARWMVKRLSLKY